MLRLSSLEGRYEGKGVAAAILGGGPSLPDDMQMLPHHCLLIAVNYHALQLCKPTFMVYNDEPIETEMVQALHDKAVIKVSPGATSDILFDVPAWIGFYSSNTAAWFALYMGCDPVILCGMDCYQGKEVYFHPTDRDCPTFHYPLDHHLRPWIEEGRSRLPHPERLRAMSGPLVGVFGAYLERS
jgi:hypothetical protein